MKKQDVIKFLEEHRDEYIQAATKIWGFAELAFQEKRSAACLMEILKKNGFQVKANVAGCETAFVAVWGQGDPVIGYMGEYDALPDLSQKADVTERIAREESANGHGCGHHVLGTAAMAAAIANKQYLQTNGLPGTIKFYGCPAEEGGGGKVLMANAGLFDDCTAAISWHPTDDNGIWSINFFSIQTVDIEFFGKNDDGLAARQTGKSAGIGGNAREALEAFCFGLEFARKNLHPSVYFRSRITDTGDVDMIRIPRHTSMHLRVYGNTQAIMRDSMEKIYQAAHGAALMTGCSVRASYDTGYSEMLPNHTLEKIMHDQFELVGTVPMTEDDWAYAERMHQALPEENEKETFKLMRFLYEEQAEPIIEQVRGKPYNDVLYPFRKIHKHKPGGTDICDVSWITPTTQCVTACYLKDTPGHSWQEVSQGLGDICMKGMLVAAKVMALTGVELCVNPEARGAVRNEFKTARAGKAYEPLLAHVREDGVNT